jgi:polyisoprenoid-binding protein YceI
MPRYNCIIKQQQTPNVMNSFSNRKTTVSILLLTFLLLSLTSHGQTRYAQSSTSRISISGTSTIHEWTMTSDKSIYDAVFETNSQGEPLQLVSLVVSVPAESLKSGKGGMDKNAYSALKTDKHKQIIFQLTSGKIDGKTIRCHGSLTIAGTTKPIEVEATYTIRSDGSIQCKGSKMLAMREYNVEPPSFMFGSVTTGNEITVSFDVILIAKTQSMSLN